MDSNGIEYVIKLRSYPGGDNKLVYVSTTEDGLLEYRPESVDPISFNYDDGSGKVYSIDMSGLGKLISVGDVIHQLEVIGIKGDMTMCASMPTLLLKPIVKETSKLVIAVDFDHTIADVDDYTCWEKPVINGLIDGAKEYINKLHSDGHTIIIYTARESENLAKAIAFLDENDVEYDFVNCNTPKHIAFMKRDSRKVIADVYIDDKNIGGIPPWSEIYNIITKLSKK